MNRLAVAACLSALMAVSVSARAEPLPDSDTVALETFFDGCIDAVGARKDPGARLEKIIADYKHAAALSPDAAHPEHKLWRVRGFDGDIEIETFTAKAWCEVRMLGADPEETARKLNNALSRLDVPMQRKSLPGDGPGVTSEAVVLGHDSNDALMLTMRKSREPKDGEPSLTLSAIPVRIGGQGQTQTQ